MIRWLRQMYVGEKPVVLPYIDKDPRGLNDDDLQAFFDASSQRTAGTATWTSINWVLDRLKRSDPVRVHRIRKDMAWVAKKAAAMGIEWDDL
jgi:hypothetical protein